MAVVAPTVEAVRVTAADGTTSEFQWDPDAWYLIRDDRPFLDLLTRGPLAVGVGRKKPLEVLAEPAPDGMRWQRWSLDADLARHRRFGEVSLALKVPKAVKLRCYVVPARVLGVADVMTILEDIEAELGIPAAWDRTVDRADRAWTQAGVRRIASAEELVREIREELRSARSVRHAPFHELGPHVRRGVPLPENSLVSHWAARRHRDLSAAVDDVSMARAFADSRAREHKPGGRHEKIGKEIDRLDALRLDLDSLRAEVAPLIRDVELTTALVPGPAFQRDHRLRLLLRAFSPPPSESISPVESMRSSYPPVFLNDLWEVWGAVWLARQLRLLGFLGTCSTRGTGALLSCSWRLMRGEVRVELDYEPDPVLVDHARLPAPHLRQVPALEWAARNQVLDPDRPLVGSELRCSPDYTIRVTMPGEKHLVVGDACLASPDHHGKGQERADSKPHTVEHYRQTIGWAVAEGVVRCHPMGGFALFPPPSSAWSDFELLQGVRDCTLLCPAPREDDGEAGRRLLNLLDSVAPGLVRSEEMAS